MKTPILLLAFAASVSALCLPTKREHVYTKGLAKVNAGQEVDREGLRVVLDVEVKNPWTKGAFNKTELVSTKTNANGLFIISASYRPGCYDEVHYRVRLYDDRRATYVLDEYEVPREYAIRGKELEKDLAGSVEIHS